MNWLMGSVQCLEIRKLWAALLVLVCHAAIVPTAWSAPWPLGTLRTNSVVEGECPEGYTCQGFTVEAPGVTEPINGVIAVGPAHTNPVRGVIVALTGGGGSVFWTKQEPAVHALGEELRSLGFTIVQVRWRGNWLHSPRGNEAGTAHLGARPATVIKHIYDTYYAPLGITPKQVGEAGFALTGNSAGSTQIALSMCYYGLDELMDVAVLTGGPPHSALAKSSLTNLDEADYWFNLDTRQFVDRGFGFYDGQGPAARHDASYISRWLEESLSTGGNDYFHPKTRIHFILGDDDPVIAANAADYYQRLRAEKTPYLTWEIAPQTGHPVYASEPGRQAIKNALLGTATPLPVLFSGERHEGSLSLPKEEDAWAFAMKAGHSFVARAAGEILPRLRLYGPDNVLLAETNPDANSTQPDVVMMHQTSRKGTYKLVVGSVSDRTGPYKLYFAKAPGSFIVPDADEAGRVQDGESRSGSIDMGDLDLWRFVTVARTEVELRVESTNITPWIRLYGPAGALAGEAKGNAGEGKREAVLKTLANRNGSYIAVISALLPGESGGYALSLKLPGRAEGLRLSVLPPTGPALDVQIAGTLGVTYELQGSEDLSQWESLLSSSLTNSPFTFRESNATFRTRRFYRALSNPQ